MSKPVLLDLFCGAGGAAKGYADAGFEVLGVDIDPQPNYPFEFIQADALEYPLDGFNAIHASPPCQAFTKARKLQGNVHPDHVAAIRERLEQQMSPWVIENVPGAPLRNPQLLCGTMFGLRTYRHRLFEHRGFCWSPPDHPGHLWPQTKMGRPPRDGEMLQIVGHFSGVPLGKEIMGMPWATQHELAEAVPVAYTEFIGRQLITALA